MDTAELNETVVVITAVGRDGPGIVAALAGVVFDLGGNLDDTTMTRLHGAFAAMVAARLPAGKSADDARVALAALAEERGLTVTVQAVADAHEEAAPDMLLTVYGADRPGIVSQVASALASRGVNITDMDTRLTGTTDAPVYVMLLELAAGEVDLASELSGLKTSLGVDMTVQALDPEAL